MSSPDVRCPECGWYGPWFGDECPNDGTSLTDADWDAGAKPEQEEPALITVDAFGDGWNGDDDG